MTTYEIWGRYESDKLPSLMFSKVNGDPICSIYQANALIQSWNIKAEQGRLSQVHDWDIKKQLTGATNNEHN